MILDYFMKFGLPDITDSNTKTVSPYVYDAGSDKIVFGQNTGQLFVMWKTIITAAASPTILIELVGSDNADGDVNENETVRNIVLGSSGIVRTTHAGATLASGDLVYGYFAINTQWEPRQYYMLNTTLGGTTPDIVAATSWAYVVRDYQDHLENLRAAIPA